MSFNCLLFQTMRLVLRRYQARPLQGRQCVRWARVVHYPPPSSPRVTLHISVLERLCAEWDTYLLETMVEITRWRHALSFILRRYRAILLFVDKSLGLWRAVAVAWAIVGSDAKRQRVRQLLVVAGSRVTSSIKLSTVPIVLAVSDFLGECVC